MSAQSQTPAGGSSTARSAARGAAPMVVIAGQLGLGYLAAEFVTQPETWPVFLAWCQQENDGKALPLEREYAKRLTRLLGVSADMAQRMQVPPGFAR